MGLINLNKIWVEKTRCVFLTIFFVPPNNLQNILYHCLLKYFKTSVVAYKIF